VKTMPTEHLPDNAMNIMAQAMRQSMPELKTQVQFTSFMAGFDAFRLLCNSIFACDSSLEEQSLEALNKAFEAMRVATKLSKQFEEIPEGERSPSANQFVETPLQFEEYDLQKRLLTELSRLTSTEDLNNWYLNTKSERDKVVSQSLRNILFDEIRIKQESLKKAQR
jgi:hypothetical protein